MNFERSKIGILLIMILSLFSGFPANNALSRESKENLFSIQAVNEPLREVLNKISKASGYEIRFNTQFSDDKISMQLKNVTLKEALARVLKSYNHLSVWDDKKHIVKLLIFKNNTPPAAMSGINRIFESATETTAGP